MKIPAVTKKHSVSTRLQITKPLYLLSEDKGGSRASTKLLGELAFWIPGLTSILTSKMTTELGHNGNCSAYLDQDVRELGSPCYSRCQ